jgi:hypothetical protein
MSPPGSPRGLAARPAGPRIVFQLQPCRSIVCPRPIPSPRSLEPLGRLSALPLPRPPIGGMGRLWAAPESCSRLDQGSTARPPGRGFQPGLGRPPGGSLPRARPTRARPTGSDRRLDRDRAVASFPRGRAACLSSNAIGR